jgi:glutamate transport system permease protein
VSSAVLYDAVGPRGRRRIAVGSVAVGVVLLLLVALALKRFADNGQFGRLSLTGLVRWSSGAYVEFFRAVPLLLLIFFTARVLPKYGLENVSALWVLVLALVVYNGAVLGEIFRAGILSLDRGQTEAAYAVGLSYWQAMLLVVVPQAVRRMVPALVSQLITLLKDTSLGFVLPYEELLRRGQLIGEVEPRSLVQGYLVAAVMFIAVNFALSRLARWLEVRQRRRYKSTAVEVAGVEDLAVLEAEGDARLGAGR